jgi:thioesterase domain-containing protein
LERRLTLIWEDVLGVRPLPPESNFFDLGGHSLLAARLFARMGQAFGQELPLAALLQAPTPGSMAQLLTEGRWAALWSSLVPIQPHGPRPPLFCVHGGGGNVISYHRLAQHLGPDQPVWGLQARSLSSDQSHLSRVEEMATHYLEAIRALQPAGPYHLAGYSLGALVALEMAQRLCAGGQQVGLLAVIDQPGPAARVTWADKVRWHLICLAQLELRDKLGYLANRVAWKLKSSRLLPRAVRRLIISLLGKSPVRANITSRRLGMIEHSLVALQKYRVRPYPGRLMLFRSRLGPAALHADSHGGWGETALAGVEVHEIPGQHMNILEEPHIRVFAEKLRVCLGRTEGTVPQGGPLAAKV